MYAYCGSNAISYIFLIFGQSSSLCGTVVRLRGRRAHQPTTGGELGYRLNYFNNAVQLEPSGELLTCFSP